MSRLKATLVLVALVFIGALAGLWIRRLGGSPPLEPDPTTQRPALPSTAPSPAGPSAAPAQNPKASLLVRIRCDGKPMGGMGFSLSLEETHQSNKYTTGPDGAHAVLGLPQGLYQLA